MRMKQIRGLMRGVRGAGLGLLLMLSGGLAARAQNADELMPAASAAKAKEILQQAIDGLGGAAYLNVHNSDCTGRLAQFQHSGALGGYTQFHSYHEMPDKSRMEYDPKGKIVDLYAGEKGWSLDRGGVSELPASAIADYQEQLQTADEHDFALSHERSRAVFSLWRQRRGGSEGGRLGGDWRPRWPYSAHRYRPEEPLSSSFGAEPAGQADGRKDEHRHVLSRPIT